MEPNFRIPVIDTEATGKNIKELRQKAKVSVKDLQIVFGFTAPTSIYRWEAGTATPTIDNFLILAKALDVTIDEIIKFKWIKVSEAKRYDGYGVTKKKEWKR